MRQSTQPCGMIRNLETGKPVARLGKALCLGLVLAVAASLPPLAASAKDTAETKSVSVLGRTWHVSPAEEAPGFYRATRLNTELLPKRPPAVLSVRQAIRAFHSATGCSANRDTLYRDISGSYFATLICPQD